MNEKLKNGKQLRVMIGDDHGIVLDGLELILKSQGFDVVAKAKSIDRMMNAYRELLPDILILDIHFGEARTGLDASVEILRLHPEAKIMFLSEPVQDAIVKKIYTIGGYAYVTKDRDISELATALQRTVKGELYFMPEVGDKFASIFLRGEPSKNIKPLPELNERQRQIFTHMAKGLTYGEIAGAMSLSPKTIANTAQQIKQTLRLDRQAEVTLLAVKVGLIDCNTSQTVAFE